VADGIRRLSTLGFVEIGDESLRLRPALLRFAEPVRGVGQPAEALAKLVADGEIAMVTEEAEPADDAEPSDDEGADAVLDEDDGADEEP
jgi:chromosome partition protein MukE